MFFGRDQLGTSWGNENRDLLIARAETKWNRCMWITFNGIDHYGSFVNCMSNDCITYSDYHSSTYKIGDPHLKALTW